ncbi:LpqB family beta-propeller domain-containing protein [Amycolatopsis cihanbeyliensis]|uniref:Lipoprotein LpqB-like beta-propeller protein n=1 Tax=Amycolatopsis cihanbeyliensis TaxID=1128664 RepID=A0A542DHI3_AMYCI|nr:LpqB family beta-propeller domain-containing protein [Amycolatopsis cihanbeyliensis]TQJ02548.1 lipoprotein LpqB-like beta-propeller protein [Amycolatopsis cihanbeyliensis]
MRPARGRGTRGVLAVLACLVLVGGCANVPEESQAEVVSGERLGQLQPDIPEPDASLDALTAVREFVSASARPINEHAAARVYLGQDVRKSWEPGRTLTIIEETFNTGYATAEERPTDPNEKVVVVSGTQIGKLGHDSAFLAARDSFRQEITVRKQGNGPWRIVDPPRTLVVTERDFADNYFRVPLYFFAPDTDALVPDLRYVVAKPQAKLPSRVADLLLDGPSDGLTGAVHNPLGDEAALDGTVSGQANGALLVPLTGVAGKSDEEKKRIAAQFVRSLQTVTSSRIRLLSDKTPLVPGQLDWRPSDLASYESSASPSSDLQGLVTLGGRVRSLEDGSPVRGPAGDGAYHAESGAQSLGGNQLAIVERIGDRARLRIGYLGEAAHLVDVEGKTLTRPTWWPNTDTNDASGELWTVVDGTRIARLVRDPNGGWVQQPVNAAELNALGPISGLRLSRDGTRAAVIAGGNLVVAAVVRSNGSVTLRSPRVLQAGTVENVVDVDWATQDMLVAATGSESMMVVRVPVDGLRRDKFNGSNLTAPVQAITAAPSRPIVVADASNEMWTASGDIGEVWRPHDSPRGSGARPFYPG